MLIELKGYTDYSTWTMQIDLAYIVNKAGKYESYYDVTNKRMRRFIPFTKNHARKIFHLIKRTADPDTINTTDCYLIRYKEIYDIWKKA